MKKWRMKLSLVDWGGGELLGYCLPGGPQEANPNWSKNHKVAKGNYLCRSPFRGKQEVACKKRGCTRDLKLQQLLSCLEKFVLRGKRFLRTMPILLIFLFDYFAKLGAETLHIFLFHHPALRKSRRACLFLRTCLFFVACEVCMHQNHNLMFLVKTSW